MSFVATAIAVSAGVGLVGAGISANAAGKASSQQQAGEANALNFQKQVYGDTQANEAPYQAIGKQGTDALSSALPSLTKGFDPGAAGLPAQFSFNGSDLANTPGYQFTQQQQEQAIQRQAAAAGGINGGTLKSLAQYDTGLADQTYGNEYARQLAAYNTNYGNAFNTFETNQGNTYNRLMGLVGIGQTATGQLANAGTNFANAAGNTAVGSANAAAAGTVGSANAISSGLSGVGGNVTNTLLLNQLLGGGVGSQVTPQSLYTASTPTSSANAGLLSPTSLLNTPGAVSASGYGG